MQPLAMIEDFDNQKKKLMTRKQRRQLAKSQSQPCQQFSTAGQDTRYCVSSYIKDNQFNAKNESVKEKHILDYFKQKTQIMSQKINDVNKQGYRFTKEEYEQALRSMREQQKVLLEQQIEEERRKQKLLFLTEGLKGQEEQQVPDEVMSKIFAQRDMKTRLIEKQVNQQIELEEEQNNQLQKEEQALLEQNHKISQKQVHRTQYFINSRQAKLRNNIQQLLVELKKIKHLDPNLEIFSEIYKKHESHIEVHGQQHSSQKTKKRLNEIDILMEVIQASSIDTDHKEGELVKREGVTERTEKETALGGNSTKARTQSNFFSSRLNSNNIHTPSSNKREPSQKQATSQPSLLTLGQREKMRLEELEKIKTKLSPIKRQRLENIQRALKKDQKNQKYEFTHGQSILGSKDYIERIRNILIERSKQLLRDVRHKDDDIYQKSNYNLDFYSIKDLMNDQWMTRMQSKMTGAETRATSSQQQHRLQISKGLESQKQLKTSTKDGDVLDKLRIGTAETGVQRREKPLLNMKSVHRDIKKINRDLIDFNRSLYKQNYQGGSTIGGAALSTFDHSQFQSSKQVFKAPHLEALDHKLEYLKPLQKVKRVISQSTTGQVFF